MPHSFTHLRLFLLLIFISILLLFSDQVFKFTLIRSPLEAPLIPLKQLFYQQKLTLDYHIHTLRLRQICQQQLADLRKQILDHAQLSAKLGELQAENARLRKLLGAPLPSQWQYLPARVIGQTTTDITIDQGTRRGVRAPMTVIAQGVLVGQVVSSTDRQSQVSLIFSPLQIPAKVQADRSQATTAKGLVSFQDNKLLLTRVLPNETVKPGSLVITTGEGDILPGIPVGNIEKAFMANPTDPFQQAVIKPLVDTSNLDAVEVIIDW